MNAEKTGFGVDEDGVLLWREVKECFELHDSYI
jgi:hypothetical protein